jgi:hypothetical protein
MKLHFIILVLLGCLLASCVYHTRPASFDTLAAQFTAKAGSNRIAEGKKIERLLPVCPTVYGGRWWYLGFDESVASPASDVSHPSYILPQEGFLQAMGKPDRYIPENLRYGIWAQASYDLGSDRNNTAWELLVTFYYNRVVGGRVIKRFTPIGFATYTSNGVTTVIRTNYLP